MRLPAMQYRPLGCSRHYGSVRRCRCLRFYCSPPAGADLAANRRPFRSCRTQASSRCADELLCILNRASHASEWLARNLDIRLRRSLPGGQSKEVLASRDWPSREWRAPAWQIARTIPRHIHHSVFGMTGSAPREERCLLEAHPCQDLVDTVSRKRTDVFAQAGLVYALDLGDDDHALPAQPALARLQQDIPPARRHAPGWM